MMVEVRSATKKYGELFALNAVSLALSSHKTHVLLGSSGSGKSTLLRAVLGTLTCDEGEVLIDGKAVRELSPRARAEKMGYVPQDAGLFPHLSARENITLVARSLGWKRPRIEARLRELKQIAPLDEELLCRFPNELSGGQKQRVAILRALFLDPPLILMDEPFASLDPLVRAEIQSEVKTLFARLRKTVLFVTHDVGEAGFLADDIVLMHEGRVVQQGQLAELVERPAEPFVTKFLSAQRVFHLPGHAP